MKRIAIFVGANTHFNVTRTVTNHGWMLSDRFDLDLVTTSPETYEPAASAHYTVSGDQFPTNRIGHARSLWNYLATESPDILLPVTRPVLYGLLASPQAAIGDMKYIYRHSGEIFRYYQSLSGWKKVTCYSARNVAGNIPLTISDHSIALSSMGKNRLANKGVDQEQITVLPPTIAPSRFESETDADLGEIERTERDIVLFIGRRTKMKGIDVLKRAVPKLLERRSDLQFVFVGEGGSIPDVPAAYEDHITIVGGVVPEKIPDYLDAASVLVLPSRTEGVPRVLLESLYMETPVLASHVGGIPSVTENTYHTETEFVEMLASYEQLPLESASGYLRSSQQEIYIDFFSRL